jgi:hypothetical protein
VVWKRFGIGDRFGFSIVPGHGHCQLPAIQRPEVEAFVDKFLLGKSDVSTDVTSSPYDATGHARWIDWWGKDNPEFPERSREGVESVMLEAESAKVGAHWQIGKDDQASNGGYAAAIAGKQSISEPPAGGEGVIEMAFAVAADGNYAVFARLDCPSADDDSFWVKMDNGSFEMFNNLGTSGWSWLKLDTIPLKAGKHALTIGLREDGAMLDKISIANDSFPPQGRGESARDPG